MSGNDDSNSTKSERVQKSLGDYVDVAQRLVEFREKHPDGSLQPADLSQPYTIESMPDGSIWVVVVAAAYRSEADQRPGIGMAWEPFPGRTPYTSRSELQNAETSAWGRAIMAALAADARKGIASQQEVRNRSAEREAGEPIAAKPVPLPEITQLIGDASSLDALRVVWKHLSAAGQTRLKIAEADCTVLDLLEAKRKLLGQPAAAAESVPSTESAASAAESSQGSSASAKRTRAKSSRTKSAAAPGVVDGAVAAQRESRKADEPLTPEQVAAQLAETPTDADFTGQGTL